jgi:hypothetical protein
VFLPFLKEHFPNLVADYDKRFKDRAFLPAAYRKRIGELMSRLRAKYKIRSDSRWAWDVPLAAEQQMNLF